MRKNLKWLKILALTAMLALLATACASGQLERLPASGMEVPGGAQVQSGGEAGTSAGTGANFEPPPTQPVCPTPTPTVGVGTTGGGESGVGEGSVGPAATEPVDVTSPGEPPADVLDQVNQGPGVGRGDQIIGQTGVGPESGTETQPGRVPEPAGSTEPTLGELINSVIGQVLGTSEPSVSFEPPPITPTPCP
jgi:hypothetical protein